MLEESGEEGEGVHRAGVTEETRSKAEEKAKQILGCERAGERRRENTDKDREREKKEEEKVGDTARGTQRERRIARHLAAETSQARGESAEREQEKCKHTGRRGGERETRDEEMPRERH
ncbi:hypothetical protein NDU88_000660 [Pleurodeles waltl]|uniref:Uncharacterized protein n=1 Tax=Pleurodeles waltl TaxID=8319 RepID=A0AAV7KMM5_PLEWA|nr:hypothetical protein NDU88_000660 [Pleurodeles waltl]